MTDAVLRARCKPQLAVLVDQAANRKGMNHPEYVRRSVVESLERDGFKVEPQQYALVIDGSLALRTDRGGNQPYPIIVTKLDVGDSRTWLPIENEDSEPFDPRLHWREKPTYHVESDRVRRIYRVTLKAEYA